MITAYPTRLTAAVALASALYGALPGHAAEGAAEGALPPEALLAQFPPAWAGVTAEAPDYEEAPAYTGEKGYARAAYHAAQNTSSPEDYILRLKDLGATSGRMYQDYGADYLKGPVADDVQHSITVKGQPALVLRTSDSTMEITTFFAPGLVLSVSCMNISEDACRAAMERLDFGALQALAATIPAG